MKMMGTQRTAFSGYAIIHIKGSGYLIDVVITDFEIAFLIWFAVILYLMVPIGPILNAWSLSPMGHLEPHLITQCSPPRSLIEPPLFSPTH